MPKARRTAQGNGTIRKRSDDSWEGRYTIGRDPGTGKQVQKSVYGKTQSEVRKKLNDIISQIDNGLYIEPTKMTVAQWLDAWLKDYTGNLKDGTKKVYVDNTNLHIKPALGAVKLDKLTSHQIQKFYNDLSKNGRIIQKYQRKAAPSGLSPKTVKNIHGILHKALKQAAIMNYIRANPADNCILPKIERKEMSVLQEDEIAQFIKTAKDHKHCVLYSTLLFCGLRRGEVLGLKWEYVNFDNGSIDIVEQLQRERKVGGELRLTSLKSSKPRNICPPEYIMELLREHKAKQEIMKKVAQSKWEEKNIVFCNDFGGYLDGDAVYQSFLRLLKRTGITKVRLHDLRHTYATTALASGVDIKTVQDSLGHHEASFTLGTYGHTTDKMKKDAANKMDGLIAKLKEE